MRVRRSVPLDVAVVRAGEGLEADEEGAEFVHELGGLLAEAFLFSGSCGHLEHLCGGPCVGGVECADHSFERVSGFCDGVGVACVNAA